jgi:hypothetical protein
MHVGCFCQKAPKQARVTAHAGPLCPQANPPTPLGSCCALCKLAATSPRHYSHPAKPNTRRLAFKQPPYNTVQQRSPQYTTATSHWPKLMYFMASVTEHPARYDAADLTLPLARYYPHYCVKDMCVRSCSVTSSASLVDGWALGTPLGLVMGPVSSCGGRAETKSQYVPAPQCSASAQRIWPACILYTQAMELHFNGDAPEGRFPNRLGPRLCTSPALARNTPLSPHVQGRYPNSIRMHSQLITRTGAGRRPRRALTDPSAGE